MSNDVNRQWRLVKRPEGNIREDDFQLINLVRQQTL
jgi:hypothetical protein